MTQPAIEEGKLLYTNNYNDVDGLITVTPVATNAGATLRIRAVKSTNPAWTNFSTILSGTSNTYDLPYGGYEKAAPHGQIFQVEVVSPSKTVTNIYEFVLIDT